VAVWDVANPCSPRAVASMDIAAGIDEVTFSPDGHTLASTSQDYNARLWDTDPERVAARVCVTADPPLSRADWDRYFPGMDYHPSVNGPVRRHSTKRRRTRLSVVSKKLSCNSMDHTGTSRLVAPSSSTACRNSSWTTDIQCRTGNSRNTA
jgi:WD40 repeat protein